MTINYLAVLVAGIAAMIVGGLWYSKFLFGKMWMSLSGMTDASMAEAKSKGMTKLYVAQFILALIGAYALAYFVSALQISTVSSLFTIVFWLWLGFQMPLLAGSVVWENKSKKLFVLKTLGDLVTLAIMGVIIVSM